jgi:hypothetical protein
MLRNKKQNNFLKLSKKETNKVTKYFNKNENKEKTSDFEIFIPFTIQVFQTKTIII